MTPLPPFIREAVAQVIDHLDKRWPGSYEIHTEFAPSIYFSLWFGSNHGPVPCAYRIRVSDHPPNPNRIDPAHSIHPGSDPASVVVRRVLRASAARTNEVRSQRRALRIMAEKRANRSF